MVSDPPGGVESKAKGPFPFSRICRLSEYFHFAKGTITDWSPAHMSTNHEHKETVDMRTVTNESGRL